MAVPKNLTREDILEAVLALRDGRVTRWGPSKKYTLNHEGEVYPPKAVLGLAIALKCKLDEWDVREFSGGAETNDVLRELGFEVIEKSKAEIGT
jgi:hypothetical protein